MTVFEEKRKLVMDAMLGTLSELRRADDRVVLEAKRYFIHLALALLRLKANNPEAALRHTTSVIPEGGGMYEKLARGGIAVIVACCAQSSHMVSEACHQQLKLIKVMKTLREFTDSTHHANKSWWRIG